MKRRVETEQLAHAQTEFLIDLVRQETDEFYVELFQHKLEPKETHKSMAIAAPVLADVIRVLQNYQAIIEGGKYEAEPQAVPREIHIAEKEQDDIEARYAKGLSVSDIAQQLGRSPELIERVLRHRKLL